MSPFLLPFFSQHLPKILPLSHVLHQVGSFLKLDWNIFYKCFPPVRLHTPEGAELHAGDGAPLLKERTEIPAAKAGASLPSLHLFGSTSSFTAITLPPDSLSLSPLFWIALPFSRYPSDAQDRILLHFQQCHGISLGFSSSHLYQPLPDSIYIHNHCFLSLNGNPEDVSPSRSTFSS